MPPGRKRKKRDPDSLLSTEQGSGEPMHSTWTSEEENLFYSALCRYGKHGISNIAEHVKTKNIVECARFVNELEFEFRERKRKKMDREDYVSKKWIDVMAVETRPDLLLAEIKQADFELKKEDKEFRRKEEFVKTKMESGMSPEDSKLMFNYDLLLLVSKRMVEAKEDLQHKTNKIRISEKVENEFRKNLKEWLKPLIKACLIFAKEKRKNTSGFEDVTAQDVHKALNYMRMFQKDDKISKKDTQDVEGSIMSLNDGGIPGFSIVAQTHPIQASGVIQSHSLHNDAIEEMTSMSGVGMGGHGMSSDNSGSGFQSFAHFSSQIPSLVSQMNPGYHGHTMGNSTNTDGGQVDGALNRMRQPPWMG